MIKTQPRSSPPRGLVLAALAITLLAAAAFRAINLEGAPPGLQTDEAFHAHDALAVREGHLALWFPVNGGNEPLFVYLEAVTTALLGHNPFGLRFAAVICGLLTVALIWRWGRLALGWRAGLLAAAAAALDFLPVWLSRVGLRVVTLPPMAALLGWLYVRALARPTIGRLALAGLVLGLAFYTYPAAFALTIIFAVFYLYLLIFRRDILRRSVTGHILFWAIAIVSYIPLALAISTQGEGYLRLEQLSASIAALGGGDSSRLGEGLINSLLMWTWQGETFWRYNVAGRPIFNAALALFFALGVFVGLGRIFAGSIRRDDPQGRWSSWHIGLTLVVLWWLGGMIPGATASVLPSNLRTSAALPAAYLLIGFGFDQMRRLLEAYHLPERAHRWWAVGVALTLLATAGATLRDYFGVWATHPEVLRAYRADLAAVARYLRDHPAPGAVAIAAEEPFFNDPLIYEATPHGNAEIHWFDADQGLLIPQSEIPGRLFLPAFSDVNSRFQSWYIDGFPLLDEDTLPDGQRMYRLYQMPTPDEFLATHSYGGVLSWAPSAGGLDAGDPATYGLPLSFPIQFGDVLQMVGVYMEMTAPPGGVVQIMIAWRVTADVSGAQNWSIFNHLIGEDGQMAAQRDFLAVPPAMWREGDLFIQLHFFTLDASTPPGLYFLNVGLYDWGSGQRFPVMVDGQAVGDRVMIQPVNVYTP